MDPTGLSQTAINVAVGGLVLTLTQTTKRWTPEGWGPIIAALWTTLALVVWLVSQPDWPPARSTYFDILAVWVSIYATALGLYSAAMIPSNSRQSIGTGNGRADAGNVPMGEAAPPAADIPTTYPILHGDHEALTALVPANGHEVLDATEARHLDGTPIIPNESVTCDRCHAKLAGVASIDGAWIASGPDSLITRPPGWLPPVERA